MKDTSANPIIIPFSRLASFGQNLVGDKGTTLGQLYEMNIPVPNGFVISTYAFEESVISVDFAALIRHELKSIDAHNSVKLENASKKIRSEILKTSIPDEIRDKIYEYYSGISGFSDTYVAVRSSLPSGHYNRAEYSGQFYTKLNVKGKEMVAESVKQCWSSLFTPENMFYFLSQGIDPSSARLAVVIQKMVQSEVSGIMFTANPVNDDAGQISIEAVLGLGDVLASGEIVPDNYLVNKEDSKVIEKHIVPQEWMMVRKGRTKKDEDPNAKIKVSKMWKNNQKLETKYITKLVSLGKKIEDTMGGAQHIEWAYEGGKIWVMQTRDIEKIELKPQNEWKDTPTFAALKGKLSIPDSEEEKRTRLQSIREKLKKLRPTDKIDKKKSSGSSSSSDSRLVVKGESFSNKVVSAPVRVILEGNFDKIMGGEIVVVNSFSKDIVSVLPKVVGVIVDQSVTKGEVKKILKNFKGVFMANSKVGTDVLRDGEMITINGSTGQVFLGGTEQGFLTAKNIYDEAKLTQGQGKKSASSPESKKQTVIKTATKILANISGLDSSELEKVSVSDGVGMIMSEEIIQSVGIHPQLALKSRGKKKRYVNGIADVVKEVAQTASDKPVIYKLSDMTSGLYSQLDGGDTFEKGEKNVFMGLRGGSRFLEYPDEVELELEALRIVRNKENFKNVSLSIPFVRTYKELKSVKKLISGFGFRRSSSFKIFMIAEVPSSVIRIEKMFDAGIDGVIVDLDDLSQLMLGIDLQNPQMGKSYIEAHPSLMESVEKVIKSCNREEIEVNISGGSIVRNPKVIRKMVEWGATGLSLHPDLIEEVRRIVSEAEKSVLKKR